MTSLTALITCLTIGLVSVVLAPRRAGAQEPSPSFESVQKSTTVGDTLVITDGVGHRIRGQLLSLSADSLDVRVDAGGGRLRTMPPTHLTTADVSRIDVVRRDSVWNGVAIGAAVGATPWLVYAIGRSGGSDPFSSGQAAGAVTLYGLLGAGVGFLIDYSIEKRATVYKKSDRPSRLGLSLARGN